MIQYNDDMTRAYEVVPFGVAIYEQVQRRGQYITFKHRGVVEDTATAARWLAGDEVQAIIIHPIQHDDYHDDLDDILGGDEEE